MIDCVVIVPVLGRPTSAQPLVDSFYRATNPGSARLLFVATDGDAAQIRACYETGEQVAVIPEAPYGPKVNAGYKASHAPWLLLGADDLEFHEGWLEAALKVGEETGKGLIGTDDLGNGTVRQGRHSTHPLVRRAYVEEQGGGWDGPGVVVHEGYAHQYTDTELVCAAKQREQWAFAKESRIEHLHPFWKKGLWDETYERGMSTSKADEALFQRRARENGWKGKW